jgi:hypothetical protein
MPINTKLVTKRTIALKIFMIHYNRLKTEQNLIIKKA